MSCGCPIPLGRPASFWSMLGGLHTSPAVVGHLGRQHGIEVEITPVGACALFDILPGDIESEIVSLADLAPGLACALSDRLNEQSDGTLGSMSSTNCSPPPSAHAWRFLPRSPLRGGSSSNPTAPARSDPWPIRSGRAPGSSASSSGACWECRRNRRPESCGSNEHRRCFGPVLTSRSPESRRVAAMPTSPTWHASGEVLRLRVRRTGDGKSADSSKTSRSQRGHTRRHGD